MNIQVHLDNSESKIVCCGRIGWVRCAPVEQEVDRDGAQVPGGVSVQHPEERREVKEFEQRQAVQQHHHHATFPPVQQRPPVLPAPAEPPQQVHHA